MPKLERINLMMKRVKRLQHLAGSNNAHSVFTSLTFNTNLPWELVVANKDEPWDWQWMSRHPNLDWRFVRENPDIEWDWMILSCNACVCWDTVMATLDRPWDWSILSHNPCTTWEMVRDHPHLPWDWSSICFNTNITWDVVRNNPEFPWDWDTLSCIKWVTWDIVRQHKDLPWNWGILSGNTHIRWETVNSEEFGIAKVPWDWRNLCHNPSTMDVDDEIYNTARREFAARKIQRMWLERYYNPKDRICKKRLRSEFEALTGAD